MLGLIKKYFAEEGVLKVPLIILGILIVCFNVMGYNILFKEEPIFWIITPIAILFFIAEMSVLLWSSSILQNWRITKGLLKGAMFVIVPIFGLLSFTGINSYLNTSATSDYVTVQKQKLDEDNTIKYKAPLEGQIAYLKSSLVSLNAEKDKMETKLNEINTANQELNTKISERRAAEKRGNCQDYPDCHASVIGFSQSIDGNKKRQKRLERDSYEKTEQINNAVAEKQNLEGELTELNKQLYISAASVSNVESKFENKKKIYEDIVIKVTGWFGITLDNPFAAFVAFISAIIYPIYFLMNLYISLSNNDSAKEKKELYQYKQERRKQKLASQKSYYELRSAIWQKLYKLFYIRLQFIRQKHKLAQAHAKLRFKQKTELALENQRLKNKSKEPKVTVTASMLLRAIRYFRVWAASRKKVRNKTVEIIKEIINEVEIEVIKEVEVIKEIQVEKEVEIVKEIDKEVKVEIPVYVDRIVEVPTEKPVYVEKLIKITEEVVVVEKEVVINEVLIPVPENISAAELEILLTEYRKANSASAKIRNEDNKFSSKRA